MDLLADRFIVPWAEAEARISQGWKAFPRVQPLPLHAARQKLRAEGAIIEETTQHQVPVSTVRLPYPPGRKRELQRLAGRRRKKFRLYLSWTGTYGLCGHQAEKVVYASAQAVATEAGLFVPVQQVGNITEVDDVPVARGTFDVLAHIFELPRLEAHTPMVFEVKNLHRWIYPWTRELWELLIKAADLAQTIQLLPVLVCAHRHFTTLKMAQDIGFLVTETKNQLFSPTIDERPFVNVKQEFGLEIVRHDGPIDELIAFGRFIRRRPIGESDPWYRRQISRFQALTPTILAHDGLAGALPDDARTRVFARFRAQAQQVAALTFGKGW